MQQTAITRQQALDALVIAESLVDCGDAFFGGEVPSQRIELDDELTVADAKAAWERMQDAWIEQATKQQGYWGDAVADFGGDLNVIAAFFHTLLDDPSLTDALPGGRHRRAGRRAHRLV
jgi:hypothetical protein